MEKKIESWLGNSGYPLELHVFSELQKRKYTCGKSEIYVDLESGLHREIDVTASSNVDLASEEYGYDTKLIFECKKSDKPLLNLCAQQSQKSRFYHQALYGDPENALKPDAIAYTRFEKNTDDESARLMPLFSEEVSIGYSLVPAFGASDKNIYSGLMGLVKASTYYRRLYKDFFDEARKDRTLHVQDRNVFEFHLAALVVDAPLFDVYVNDDGEVGISKSDWSLLKLKLPWNFDPYDSEQGYCIHVVTKNIFSEFLDELKALTEFIAKPEHVNFILDRRRRVQNKWFYRFFPW